MAKKQAAFNKWSMKMRKLHRFTGFFMMGILMIYAVSGIILIYRGSFIFKLSSTQNVQLQAHLSEYALIKQVAKRPDLQLRRFTITKDENGIISFAKNRYNTPGTYNQQSGMMKYTLEKYPYIIQKLVNLHTSSSEQAHSPLNVLFALTLLLFIFTAFFMFNPKSPMFKQGMLIMASGVLFAIILVLIV